MKPPVIPRILEEEENEPKRSEADDDRASLTQSAPPAEPQLDPFKDFAAVSKPDAPTEVQLQAEDAQNIENDIGAATVKGSDVRDSK